MPNDIWGSVWPSLAAFLIAGIAIYLFDRKWGVGIYRFLYDLFHSAKAAMPKDVERGFLYRQPARKKFVSILVFTGVTGFFPPFSVTGANIIAQIILPLLQTPVLWIGFGLGTLVHRLLQNRNKVFDTVDSLGEQVSAENVGQMAKQATTLGGSLIDSLFGIPRAVKEIIWPDTPPASTPPAQPASEPPAKVAAEEPSPQDLIDNFTKRRR